MEVERELKITLVMTEEEANLMLYGLAMGRNHVRDHIHPDDEKKQKPILDNIYELENAIREKMLIIK